MGRPVAPRGRGAVRHAHRRPPGPRPDRRGIRRRRRRLRRGRLEYRPAAPQPSRSGTRWPSSWPPTAWPGPRWPTSRSSKVRAAFYYVRRDRTVRPADLLDEAGLTPSSTGFRSRDRARRMMALSGADNQAWVTSRGQWIGSGHVMIAKTFFITKIIRAHSTNSLRHRKSLRGNAEQTGPAVRLSVRASASAARCGVAGGAGRLVSRSTCSWSARQRRRRCSPRGGRPAWCRGSGRCRRPWPAARRARPARASRRPRPRWPRPRRRARRLRWKFSPVKRGLVLPPVVVGEVVDGADLPGQEARGRAASRRRSRCRARAAPAAPRLLVAGPQRVLGLQRGDRVHGVRAADGVGPGLGQPDVADLALGHQLGQRADGVLDRRVRVHPVLVVEVDVVGAEPPQRSLDRGADVGRAAVEVPRAAAGVRHEAELGRQHHLVAAALDGPADELLVGERAVDLGGVDEGDAQFERPVDGADRLGVVGARAG